jgi:hypothetical protein
MQPNLSFRITHLVHIALSLIVLLLQIAEKFCPKCSRIAVMWKIIDHPMCVESVDLGVLLVLVSVYHVSSVKIQIILLH